MSEWITEADKDRIKLIVYTLVVCSVAWFINPILAAAVAVVLAAFLVS